MSSGNELLSGSRFACKRTLCGIAAIVLIAALPSKSVGAVGPVNLDTDSPHSGIEYRRIYVPNNKTEAWPRDGEKYIPIDAHDFDALIHSANSAASSIDSQVIIESAKYSGELDANGRLHGEAQWTIALHKGAATFLPLTDTSLI